MKRLVVVLNILFMLALAVLMWANPLQGSAQAVNTPTVTRTPRRNATPTPTAVTGALAGQLATTQITFLNPLHGLSVACDMDWKMLTAKLPETPELPFIYSLPRVGDYGGVCIYGMPFVDRKILVDLFWPDGELADSAELHSVPFIGDSYEIMQDQPALEGPVGVGAESDGVPFFSVQLWLPPGLPEGTWWVDAVSLPPGAEAAPNSSVNDALFELDNPSTVSQFQSGPPSNLGQVEFNPILLDEVIQPSSGHSAIQDQFASPLVPFDPSLPSTSLSAAGGVVFASGPLEVTPHAIKPDIGWIKPKVGGYPANTSPFTRPPGKNRECRTVTHGEGFEVFMVNLNPGASFTVGAYFPASGQFLMYDLVRQYPFKVNKKGNQRIVVTPAAGDPPGIYTLVLVLNTKAEKLSAAGPTTCYKLVQ